MKRAAQLVLLSAAVASANAHLRSYRRAGMQAEGGVASLSTRASFPEEWQRRFPESELQRSQEQADKWAQEVKEAMLFSWGKYKEQAWGHDEIKPVSGGTTDWVGLSVSMIDALTTLHLMGLKAEFEDAAHYIQNATLPIADEGENSFFEVTIRALGGLMGAWSLTGEPVFRDAGRHLANNMMPAFRTRTGMPAHSIDVSTGVPQEDYGVVLAEAGTLQMEFQTLTDATKDTQYIAAADKSEDAVLTASGPRGMIPNTLSGGQSPPVFMTRSMSMGGAGDSYYEYLLKHWLQTGKKQTALKDKWRQAMSDMQRTLVDKTAGGRTYLAQIDQSGFKKPSMDHLSCFVPGMLMLGSRSLPKSEVDPDWEPLAEELTETCYQMYNRTETGLAPDYTIFVNSGEEGEDMRVPEDGGAANLLRPEVAESLFYMHYYTGDHKYRRMAYDIFSAMQKHSKAAYGFAQVADVRSVPAQQQDTQPTWWFAETMKYLFLTFAPRETLDLNRWVLNTEAHPMKIHV
mmetsp:Transcript_35470/g.102151  ORF Transcript_35470/g.102151 Transcript_35470/m.102151 type:complete len:515 (+) Transcript_35470:49-1593(+)